MEELSGGWNTTGLGSKTARVLQLDATTKYRETVDNNIDQKVMGNFLEYVGAKER
jgi:hypothetical protein